MAYKMKDLRELSLAELEKKLRDTREEQLKARLQKQTGQLDRPHLIQDTRRDIARLETLLTEKRRTSEAALA